MRVAPRPSSSRGAQASLCFVRSTWCAENPALAPAARARLERRLGEMQVEESSLIDPDAAREDLLLEMANLGPDLDELKELSLEVAAGKKSA